MLDHGLPPHDDVSARNLDAGPIRVVEEGDLFTTGRRGRTGGGPTSRCRQSWFPTMRTTGRLERSRFCGGPLEEGIPDPAVVEQISRYEEEIDIELDAEIDGRGEGTTVPTSLLVVEVTVGDVQYRRWSRLGHRGCSFGRTGRVWIRPRVPRARGRCPAGPCGGRPRPASRCSGRSRPAAPFPRHGASRSRTAHDRRR